MAANKSYTPKLVAFSYAGQLLTGYADGDFASATFSEDAATLIVGADGESCFIDSANKSGEVTLTLLRSSNSNDLLMALYQSQRIALVPKPLYVKDISGRSVISGQKAIIKKAPDLTFGKEMSNTEWVFLVADLEVFIGGNN